MAYSGDTLDSYLDSAYCKSIRGQMLTPHKRINHKSRHYVAFHQNSVADWRPS